ncbi:MAG: hypothetical protein NZ849_11835 [Meiothermus sp.]|uniref:hypothetical protein n=1 Tax=Meiothermus sp. TaxID=1955249 RepID=UPI0025EC5AEA|nr:hypothetical protein [Meiothermus sp.]MCS7195582.1 hypothetical protein [Meiothermus sp.]MDW8091931.1 hypothetical protein [Meiothermus sp.]MDW8480990.1 hypothetical protein [Meiothermus sp.]
MLNEALQAAGEVPLLRARALLNLGVVRKRQGRTEEAQESYRRSLEAEAEPGTTWPSSRVTRRASRRLALLQGARYSVLAERYQDRLRAFRLR